MGGKSIFTQPGTGALQGPQFPPDNSCLERSSSCLLCIGLASQGDRVAKRGRHFNLHNRLIVRNNFSMSMSISKQKAKGGQEQAVSGNMGKAYFFIE